MKLAYSGQRTASQESVATTLEITKLLTRVLTAAGCSARRQFRNTPPLIKAATDMPINKSWHVEIICQQNAEITVYGFDECTGERFANGFAIK